jgi:lysophospholipase L1-like esterase
VTKRLTTIARNLLLAIAALLAAFLICELLLRLLGISYPVFHWTDPVRGVSLIPGAQGDLTDRGRHIRVEINRDGFRGPDATLERPAGTYRIALLGDSYVQGFDVVYDQTVGEVLERRLATLRGSPVEVLNFGVGGYGTGQELLTLQHKVWKYSPDLVLLLVTPGNDISDNSRPLKRYDYIPYYVFRDSSLVLDTNFLQSPGYQTRALWTGWLQGVIQHSRLVQLLNRVRHVQRRERLRNDAAEESQDGGRLADILRPPTTPEWQTAWAVTEGLLRMMRDECKRKHVPFAMVTLSNGLQVSPLRDKKKEYLRRIAAPDFYYADRRLKEFGQREGIPVFNLAPTMSPMAEQRQVYFHSFEDQLGIGHWNREGHRVAGELIAEWVQSLESRVKRRDTKSSTPRLSTLDSRPF